MKPIILICFLIISSNCFSQDTLRTKESRGYFKFGGSTTFSKNLPGTINVSLISVPTGNFLFGVRYFYSIFKEAGYPDEGIFHTLDIYQLSIGTTFYLQKIGWILSTGPAYIKYVRPENIKRNRNWLGPSYGFDEIRYNLFGWSTKLETKVYSSKAIAVTLGGVFNYNAKVNTGGVNIGLIVPFETLNKHMEAREVRKINKRKRKTTSTLNP